MVDRSTQRGPDLPSGTVTFLFTDIEGSTARWEHQPEAMAAALARHDALLRSAIHEHGGYVVKTMGDAFHAVFSRAPDALAAAIDAQRRLVAESWDEVGGLRVRMTLHTGAAEERDGDYYGPPLNRAARLLSAGHGGQVLLSELTYELIRDTPPEGASLVDLGEHRLKDLIRPERIYELVIADLASDFPPLRTLDARPHNLPLQMTPLLGRDADVQAVLGLLLRDEVRLVTLTGPGGTGKTRLGLQVAADLLDHFEDGVFVVELAPITDPGLVPSTIAQVLGVRDVGGRPLLDAIVDYLRTRQLLLLLDNFEQVLAAAPVVTTLLRGCSGLRVLSTSRAPLQIGGEQEYPVPPLALPDAGQPMTAKRLSQYAAVALFVERAVAVRPDFAVTNANAPAVAEICHRLDGLPLAIELAAARVRMLTPEAMVARLGHGLGLLAGGRRDVPARQQTLRNAIAWSYDLLDAGERRLFRLLGVFVGGFTLEAAEAVCTADDLDRDALDGLESLVSKSLVKQHTEVTADVGFSMLETIREYALEQLEASGEAATARRRHAEYFVTFAEEADLNLRGPNQTTYLSRIEVDHDNLRAAISWACDAGEAELALRLSGALAWFWFIRSYFGEGRRWLDRALSLPGTTVAARVRANALSGAGIMARNQGDYGRALACHEGSLALRRSLENLADVGWSLGALARVYRSMGDRQRSEALFEESLATVRRTRSVWHLGWCLRNYGAVVAEGEHSELGRAAALLEEGLQCYRQSGDTWAISSTLQILARVAERQSDIERATQLDEESLALSRVVGNRDGVAMALRYLGGAALACGDAARAASAARESLQICLEIWNREETIRSADLFGGVLVTQGDDPLAVRLLGASTALREAVGVGWRSGEREMVDRYLDLARSRLGDAAFAAAWAEGRAMSLEQAIADALEDPESA